MICCPGTHLLDSGYVDADFLVTARPRIHIDVIGPAFGSYSRQRRERAEATTCRPLSSIGRPSRRAVPRDRPASIGGLDIDVSGDPVMRIRFDGATCRACPTRQACTSARGAPRQLTVRLQVSPRGNPDRAATPGDAGVQSPVLPCGQEWRVASRKASRRFDLRRSRYLGLARTHLQQLLTATAMNIVRVIAWLRGEPLGGAPAAARPFCPSCRPIRCHARRCSAKEGLTQQSQSLLYIGGACRRLTEAFSPAVTCDGPCDRYSRPIRPGFGL